MPSQQATQQQAAPRRPRWPIPLALLGVLGLVLAAILAWGVAPSRKQLPEDLNTTRDFSGTANALLSPQAVQAGDFGNALLTNLPVTAQRTVRVLDTEGDAARVQEDRTLLTNGEPLGTTSNTYAVDRRSLEPATNVPGDWNVQPHEGLTVSFPIGVERRDYTGWVTETQSTTSLRFVREESRGGVDTYVFEADTARAPIRDEAVLSALPSSLSRGALQGIVPALPLNADQREVLAQALPGLPEQVPVTYTYESGATYWVEPTTGMIVDTQQQVVRTGTIGGPGGATLATLPVYNVDTRFTDDTVATAAREANDRRNAATTVGTTWPWVLAVLGVLALLAGLLGLIARRRPQRETAAPPPAYRPTERTTTVDPDAARRMQATRGGQPQPPYVGQTPHSGPYREARTGQEPAGGQSAGQETTRPQQEPQDEARRQPGTRGGPQPPSGNR